MRSAQAAARPAAAPAASGTRASAREAVVRRDRLAVVEHLERLAGEQLVARMVGADVDAQAPAAVQQPEARAG